MELYLGDPLLEKMTEMRQTEDGRGLRYNIALKSMKRNFEEQIHSVDTNKAKGLLTEEMVNRKIKALKNKYNTFSDKEIYETLMKQFKDYAMAALS